MITKISTKEIDLVNGGEGTQECTCICALYGTTSAWLTQTAVWLIAGITIGTKYSDNIISGLHTAKGKITEIVHFKID